MRHADGITIRNLRAKLKEPDAPPAFVFDDVSRLHLERTVVQSASHELVMVLQQGRDAGYDLKFPAGYGEARRGADEPFPRCWTLKLLVAERAARTICVLLKPA